MSRATRAHRRWVCEAEPVDCSGAARRWGVPPLVAQLLINRGIAPTASPADFLEPRLKDLHPPDALGGATQAARQIVDAVRAKRRIVLYGDYDVDGTTGVAILWHVLTAIDADVSYYVPHRVDEGYGLNLHAVRKLADDGAALIVSVDCGISAAEVAEDLARRGVSLIVTDHHQPPPELPCADVIVHPEIGAAYPNRNLCGAGVAFKLAWAIAQCVSKSERVSPKFQSLLMDLLPLAALGTIADVVSLTGENRIIAKHGLTGLRRTRFVGLRALMEQSGLADGRISGYDVGFKLAPRINAAGRMGHARLAVELLTRADERRAREIALYLEDHNRTRQRTERTISKEAKETIERRGLAGDARRAIVLASSGWHAGVLGIVASRIVDRYHRPAIVIGLNGDEGQGSGRSIRHFDLHGALSGCADHLLSFGGHKMAGGLKIESRRVNAFAEAFVALAGRSLTGEDLVPRLRLDAEASLDELNMETASMISGLGPFGEGNPKPVLASKWLELADEPRCIGQRGDHISAVFRECANGERSDDGAGLPIAAARGGGNGHGAVPRNRGGNGVVSSRCNGVRIRGVGFGLAPMIEDLKHHRRCRVAFEPTINEFNGRRTVEMHILDIKFPAG